MLICSVCGNSEFDADGKYVVKIIYDVTSNEYFVIDFSKDCVCWCEVCGHGMTEQELADAA